MPQLDIAFYPAQIFWLLVSFGLLFVAMKFWLLPPIEAILNEREEKMKAILRQADKLSAQAERMGKSYQQYVDDAAQYSARLLQTAHDEIAINYANQEEELLQTLKKDTDKAKKEIHEAEGRILGRLETITVQFIQVFMRVFFKVKMSEKSLKKDVSELIKESRNVG